MPRQDPALKWKIVSVFACLGLALVCAMAYNLGSANQDTPNQRLLDGIVTINQLARDRLQLCLRQQQEAKGQSAKVSRADIDRLSQETDLLVRENELLQQTSDDLSETGEECEVELAREADIRALQVNASEVIARLEFENAQLEGGLSGLNSSKQDRRSALRTRVRALRLENQRLRAQKHEMELHQQKEAKLRRTMEKERAQLQKDDIGLGQRVDGGSLRGQGRGRGLGGGGNSKEATELLSKMAHRMEREGKLDPAKRGDDQQEVVEAEDWLEPSNAKKGEPQRKRGGHGKASKKAREQEE